MGAGVLSGQTGTGQEPCVHVAVFRAALAEDSLEDVADPHAL